jgi:DNA (cytosine-5)-methyltransferase 1
MSKHRYNYNWNLKDTIFTKNKGKVFSCFACGGGSTMGYKLAGFDVIGCNEIDPKIMEVYKANHNPKYSFLDGIQNFKDRNNLPEDLYNLDILDGSPPCSSFSMMGNREKDWGKYKKFREGKTMQILDTLFFDFINLGKKLQPKIIIAENVPGLIFGNAKKYTIKILSEFNKAGYVVQYFVLNAANMGVPQERKRIFFIALRKDLSTKFLIQKDLFTQIPKINLEFNEKKIPIKDFDSVKPGCNLGFIEKYWKDTPPGVSVFNYLRMTKQKQKLFSYSKADFNKPFRTITSSVNSGEFREDIPTYFNNEDLIKGGSFPSDYNFLDVKHKYLIGMSVPPVMMANIATEIYNQWLKNI